MTSSESAEIATLVLRAMAARRWPCTSARLSRVRAYTGSSTTMSVSSTAAALTPAIFQRKGSRDARAPNDEDRTFLRSDADLRDRVWAPGRSKRRRYTVRTVTLDRIRQPHTGYDRSRGRAHVSM